MFSNRSFEVVSFNSQLSDTKSESYANVQTTEIVCTSNDVQTIEKKDVETQTIVEDKKKPEVDYDKLADFLKRVTPGVLEALDEAYSSNAFDDYEPTTNEDISSSAQLVKKICTVDNATAQLKVSDLSWGVGGGTLAVSHSIVYHDTWCDHLSNIQLYSLTKENQSIDTPNKTLETNSCVTTLSYHPTEPSIIAAGLFNGDVIVWNLRDDNSITPVQVCTHGDTVSQIYWKPRTLNNVSSLVSSSKDGYIFVHNLLANFTTVSTNQRFKVMKEHNPVENSRPRSAGGSRERAIEAGLCITCFDFSHKDSSIFIVGTLCGGIYKCNTSRVTTIEGDDNLLDPVIDEYERQEGSITCIKCSPIRNSFIASSTDKYINIFDFDQHTSLQTISVEDTVIGLTWMIGNQDTFAAYGAGTVIRFYNVTDGRSVSNVKLDAPSKDGTSSLRVNSKRDMLAMGDTQGNVEIWKVPRQLF